jgi:hypothetical protein
MTSHRHIVDQIPSSWFGNVGYHQAQQIMNPVALVNRNGYFPTNTEMREVSRHRSSVSSVPSTPFIFPRAVGHKIYSSQYDPQRILDAAHHHPLAQATPQLSNSRVHGRTSSGGTKNLPYKISHNTKHKLSMSASGHPVAIPALKQQLFDSASLTAASSLRTLAGFPVASAECSVTDPLEQERSQGTLIIKKRQARKCKFENCINTVVQGGLCISHGAKRKQCGHPGCSKKVKKAGMCSTHGPARKRCEHESCSNIAVQGGLCITHGAKKRICNVPGCNKKARAVFNQMCKRHHDECHQDSSSPFDHVHQRYGAKCASLISPGSSLGDDSSEHQERCFSVGATAAR